MLVVLLVMLLAVLFVVAGCSSDDAAADQIHGTWLVGRQSVYLQFAEDGTWGGWQNPGLAGDPFDWGTYTFDGETLVQTNAEGSYCDGAVAIWTVEFSDDGQESKQTIVDDTCTDERVKKGVTRVLVRQTP